METTAPKALTQEERRAGGAGEWPRISEMIERADIGSRGMEDCLAEIQRDERISFHVMARCRGPRKLCVIVRYRARCNYHLAQAT